MRIVSFVPFPNWNTHFGTDLEIIQNHLDMGDEVEVVVCNSYLRVCDTNPSHSLQGCLRCIGKRWAGFRLLSGQISQRNISSLVARNNPKLETLRYDFNSLDDLKSYEFCGFDIGYAVLASLVSIIREPRPDLQVPRNNDLLRKLLLTSAMIFLSFGDYFDKNRPDRVYVFNARFANTRAVLRACQLRQIECFCHDRGSTIEKYELYRDALPHDRNQFAHALAAAWNAEKPEIRTEMGHRFFRERRKATEQSWIAYTKDQKAGMLPKHWDSSKRNIAIFVSSEDEYVAIGREWEGGVYQSQDEGIRQIADAFRDSPEFHFYVRVHPNLKFIDNSQTRALNTIASENLSIIPAESPVSSYALMDQCEKVMVFGSTMGIEATYSGKPSIVCRAALYTSLETAFEAVYEPHTHVEVVNLIRARLKPKPSNYALMFGHHMRTFGIPFKYFQPKHLFHGTFRAGELKPNKVIRGMIAVILWIRRMMPTKIRQRFSRSFASTNLSGHIGLY
jgi:hypothetical protein